MINLNSRTYVQPAQNKDILKQELFQQLDLTKIENMFRIDLTSDQDKVIFVNCINIITVDNISDVDHTSIETLMFSLNTMINQEFKIPQFFKDTEGFIKLRKLCMHSSSTKKNGLLGIFGIGDDLILLTFKLLMSSS